jgi:hypothetical protein
MIEPTTSSIIAVTAAALLGLWTVLREIYWSRRFNRLHDNAAYMLKHRSMRELVYAPTAPHPVDCAMRQVSDRFDLEMRADALLEWELNAITHRLTAFKTFTELVSAPGYTLSLNLAQRGAALLASAYDKHKRAAGSGKRANTYTA